MTRCRESGISTVRTGTNATVPHEHANMRTRGVRPCSHVRPVKNRDLHCDWQLRPALRPVLRPVKNRGFKRSLRLLNFSVLLVATDARSTSRDRLRAMPCQKEENERSEVKSAKTIRMSLFAANDSRLAKKAFKKMRTKSASGGDGLFTNPRIVARSQR